jgi:hypothetical protein
MSNFVDRPKAAKKKIHSKNEFELCYLRHQYFRKANYNPTEAEMRPFMRIVEHLAKNTFFTYRNLFHMVGLESEDVINIGRIHLVSFLGLFALERMPEKYKDFVNMFKERSDRKPSTTELMDKNKANLTMFLKQRMEDVVRVCRQKARNIRGVPTEEFYVYYGLKKPPKVLRNLLEDHEKFGFRKIDMAVFRSIKKKLNRKNNEIFKFNQYWYVCVPVEQKSLGLIDFSGAGMDPYDNMHNMDPERILFNKQETEYWKDKKEKFDNYADSTKMRLIATFVRNNNNNPIYSEELKTAKKMLKAYGVENV